MRTSPETDLTRRSPPEIALRSMLPEVVETPRAAEMLAIVTRPETERAVTGASILSTSISPETVASDA